MEIDFSADREEWNKFVEENGGTVFHLYEWPEILHKTYGYIPVYFCARENGELKGIMPAIITRRPFGRRLVSLPFADYSGSLPSNGVGTEILKFAMKFSQDRKLGLMVYSLVESPLLRSYRFFDTFWLDTTRSFDSAWSENFSKKVRNAVRKAGKMGVVVQKETGEDFLKEYYKIYLETMHRLSAMPHHYSFFRNLRVAFGEKFEMYSARYNGELIAGIITLTFNQRTHVWSNASKKKYLYLAPNNALYCEVIRRACESDVVLVDLGTSLLNTTHYQFKAAWGGEAKPVYTLANFSSKIPETRSRVLKMIPTKILGHVSRFVFSYLF